MLQLISLIRKKKLRVLIRFYNQHRFIIYLLRCLMLKIVWSIAGSIFMLGSIVRAGTIEGMLAITCGILCYILGKLIEISCQIEEKK